MSSAYFYRRTFCFYGRTLPATLFIAAVIFSLHAHSAEWRECEQAKRRELKLQRNTDTAKRTSRKTHRRDEDRHQRAEEVDTWLWKNCREFSYELRQLEQQSM